jgi:hypothetical protein
MISHSCGENHDYVMNEMISHSRGENHNYFKNDKTHVGVPKNRYSQ